MLNGCASVTADFEAAEFVTVRNGMTDMTDSESLLRLSFSNNFSPAWSWSGNWLDFGIDLDELDICGRVIAVINDPEIALELNLEVGASWLCCPS
mgnify:CR=1 FL=1